eukprot:Clim_evm32s141 gene=Clim_evmTU32s141
MARKKLGGASSAANIAASLKDDAKEVPLTAVVIADSFNHRFMPITAETPRVLLPLCNTPIIDYVLHFLVASDVEEIYVFCTAHSQQISSYLQSSWSKAGGNRFRVHCIVSHECRSTGDALRELLDLNIVSDDFVLVSGHVVTNMNLKQALAGHKARKAKDEYAILTNVYNVVPVDHHSRDSEDQTIIGLMRRPKTTQESDSNGDNGDSSFSANASNYDAGDSLLLGSTYGFNPSMMGGSVVGTSLYQTNTQDYEYRVMQVHPKDSSRDISIPLSLWDKQDDTIEFRSDLMDSHICIASPQLLAEFKSNFDYEDRMDFLKASLDNFMMGYKVYAEIIEDDYAAVVANPAMYAAISRDVIHRWSHPLVPDNNMCDGDAYRYARGNIYMDRNVKLARSTDVSKGSVVGSGTVIGENTRIVRSVIGRNCSIGENVVIEDSYLWESVHISDNVNVKGSIVCNRVKLDSGVRIKNSCVLGQGVSVDKDCTIGPDQSLTLVTSLDDRNEAKTWIGDAVVPGEDVKDNDVTLVGPSGQGRLFDAAEIDDWDDSETDSDEDGDGDFDFALDDLSDISLPPKKQQGPSVAVDPTVIFYAEVLDSIRRGMKDNVAMHDLTVEVNASKHAYNIPLDDMKLHVVKAIFSEVADHLDASNLVGQITEVVQKFKSLIMSFLSRPEDRLDVIFTLEEVLEAKPEFKVAFQAAMKILYDYDIIDEDTILEWYNDEDIEEDERRNRKLVEQFIEWLEEAEEDSDDDDEDDD